MNFRIPKYFLLVCALFSLGACSAGVGSNDAGSATGGAIEFAAADVCFEEADPNCVAVMGENLMLTFTFERAGVEDATVAEGQGPNTVDVTFTKDGAAVLRTVTAEAAQAGDSARLVMKIGEEIHSVVTVMQAIDDGRTQIDLRPDVSAQEGIDLIRAG
ncbi:MAG: hypothetical protein Q4P23_10905 [Micrococcaceae bacterium]|nr:hypothetical protein [Micrococcaceae bacterium]